LGLVEELEADEEPEHGTPERLRQPRRVVDRPRDEGPVWPKAAVGHEPVQMRMPVGARAVRRQAGHDANGELALARQRANGGRDRAGRDAGDLAEQATAVQTVGAEPLGDREHDLPVRHRCEERGVQPLRPDHHPLGMTARTEGAAFAGEREQVLVRAGVAADAGEAVLQYATREQLVGDLPDDGPHGPYSRAKRSS